MPCELKAILKQVWQVTRKLRNTADHYSRLSTQLALMCARLTAAYSNLSKTCWFSSLLFQRFQALLTLFPKSFSSFPHGTCSLSVSSPYLALDEIYHLIYAPIPRSVTLRTSAVDSGHQAKHRILTRAHALFQEAYARAADSTMPAGYIPKPKLRFPA